jgi:hypothetical protein
MKDLNKTFGDAPGIATNHHAPLFLRRMIFRFFHAYYYAW